MTEEEKKNFKHIKERAEYVSENILGTNVFTTYDVYCVNMLIEIIQKQDTEINKLNNVIDDMVKHIVEQTYKDLEECEFEDKYNIKCNSSKRTCDDCIKEYFMKENTNE